VAGRDRKSCHYVDGNDTAADDDDDNRHNLVIKTRLQNLKRNTDFILTTFSVHILEEEEEEEEEEEDHVSLGHAHSLLERWGRGLVLMSNMTVRKVI
jgi:hypothetical protein